MDINILGVALLSIIPFLPYSTCSCHYQMNSSNGTLILSPYTNNLVCSWILNLSSIVTTTQFRSLLLTFRHFDTEFGRDELLIGETVPDVSQYNSKLFRFSGSKLPDPCLIPLRHDIISRSIWLEFSSDESNTGSGFIIDYVFLINRSISTTPQQQKLIIDADVQHPSEYRRGISSIYPFPIGTISSPNYPQNYSNNIICRWRLYHRHAVIRLYLNHFESELYYDTLSLYLGQNSNNYAMILHQWSGNDPIDRHIFIPNDYLLIVFNSDKSNNASGFLLHYEIIEKEICLFDIHNSTGNIHSHGYPTFLRTNVECTWQLHVMETSEIAITIVDIHLDNDEDLLQIVAGDIRHTLNTPTSFRFVTMNNVNLTLTTKHTINDDQFRGFNLTYQTIVEQTTKSNVTNESIRFLSKLPIVQFELSNYSLSPCGRKIFSNNGTIEVNSSMMMSSYYSSFDCLILIEVDDGQNIFLRLDHIDWDTDEDRLEIGLWHDPNYHRLFKISDTLPGTWFITNHSQVWIRFRSSQFSLSSSSCRFRLFYSETILWSTNLPEGSIETITTSQIFPFHLTSSSINRSIFYNLTKAHTWHIDAFEDECIRITFRSLTTTDSRRICFHLKDAFKTSAMCSSSRFPSVVYHIGSLTLVIEPEFIWILVLYDILIEKFKKKSIFDKVSAHQNGTVLTIPILDPFIHIEWSVNIDKYVSGIIFDVENFDVNIPAELIIAQNGIVQETYSLATMSTRFAHVIFAQQWSLRVIYKSHSLPIENRRRLFRVTLYALSNNTPCQQSLNSIGNFVYIYHKTNHLPCQWTVHGKDDNSTFVANVFGSNFDRYLFSTTANVNLTNNVDFLTEILSTDFDIRFDSVLSSSSSIPSEFVIVLYEQLSKMNEKKQNFILNKSSDLLETIDYSIFDIQLTPPDLFDTIDFIITVADQYTYLRISNSNDNSGHFLLNSSATTTVSAIVGLRFSIKSSRVKLELQSDHRTRTQNRIQLRYKARLSSSSSSQININQCWVSTNQTNLFNRAKVCSNNNSQTCNEPCSMRLIWTTAIPTTRMNNTRMHHRLWPYALRGSVTLIIENTTIENFEQTLYRTLRVSIAKIVRKFCSTQRHTCLSNDADAVRADHVIIQSYEEHADNHRLYVAVFIKDPYRQEIGLTNDQFLLALKRNQQQLYHDIQHHINLPTTFYEQPSLDPVWLYGVCFLALLVLVIVILMLITILARRRYRSTDKFDDEKQINKAEQRTTADRTELLISSPIRSGGIEDDEHGSSSCCNETESSNTSNSVVIPMVLSQPRSTTSYFQSSSPPTSYFHSTIESVMRQRLDDDEPIPFIDDNLSIAPSRKSSTCWSDRTSLSSRFGLGWRLNRSHFRSPPPPPPPSTQESSSGRRRYHQHRTNRYSVPPAVQQQQQLQFHDEL